MKNLTLRIDYDEANRINFEFFSVQKEILLHFISKEK